MIIHPNEVHIWSARLVNHAEASEAQWSSLNEEEQQRALRLRQPADRKRFILYRAFLRQLIANYLNIKPSEVRFDYSKHNKPYLDQQHQSQLEFNISHSHDIALFAFCLNHPVGIDIEIIDSEFHSGVAKRYFHPDEQMQLTELAPDERNRAFYQIWAKKEALTKATGKGLHLPLASFSVDPRKKTEKIDLDSQNWTLIELNTNKNYAAAIAYAGLEKELLYYEID